MTLIRWWDEIELSCFYFAFDYVYTTIAIAVSFLELSKSTFFEKKKEESLKKAKDLQVKD
jgi:hypothetical protein